MAAFTRTMTGIAHDKDGDDSSPSREKLVLQTSVTPQADGTLAGTMIRQNARTGEMCHLEMVEGTPGTPGRSREGSSVKFILKPTPKPQDVCKEGLDQAKLSSDPGLPVAVELTGDGHTGYEGSLDPDGDTFPMPEDDLLDYLVGTHVGESVYDEGYPTGAATHTDIMTLTTDERGLLRGTLKHIRKVNGTVCTYELREGGLERAAMGLPKEGEPVREREGNQFHLYVAKGDEKPGCAITSVLHGSVPGEVDKPMTVTSGTGGGGEAYTFGYRR